MLYRPMKVTVQWIFKRYTIHRTVRLSVQLFVRSLEFLEKSAHQIFLIFCMKPCLYVCKKLIVSFLGRKIKIGPFLVQNGPNLAIFGQNGPKSMFFAHIFKETRQIFPIFCMKPCLYVCKKLIVSFLGRKIKIGPFLVQNGPNLAIFGQNGPKSMFFAHISKVTHQIFLIFCLKPCLYECKKLIVSFFGRKFKIGPFLVQNGLFWTIFDQKWGKRDTSCKNAPIRLKFGQKLHFSGVYPFIFLLSSIPQN